MNDRDEGRPEKSFLSRWSRRKLEQEVRGEQEVRLVTETEMRRDESLPPAESASVPVVDTLDENSNYSGFLAPGVSEELQRIALRKLFGSARFNIRDGLDDYDEDYRLFESLGDTITADLRHRVEREAEAVVKSERGSQESSPMEEFVADESPAQETDACNSQADASPDRLD